MQLWLHCPKAAVLSSAEVAKIFFFIVGHMLKCIQWTMINTVNYTTFNRDFYTKKTALLRAET